MDHTPGFLRAVDAVRPHVREVDVATMREALATGHAVVLDVREDREWARGHVPGARHIARGVLERDVERAIPDPATPLILYCGGGYRSMLAADALQRMGYTDVRSMTGGWREYVVAGGQVVVPASPLDEP
ncbi:MAG: rhodanese-like domain-containing protein [Gemmatimonadaceae bacterium]|jgi:rhodanese-related sulfurtransferase|nr:rhodanese-like domain-containing protein [Gemmatimonadaceae bacterium]